MLLVDNALFHNTLILHKTSVIANNETEDINNYDQERVSSKSDSGDHESDKPQNHSRLYEILRERLRERPTERSRTICELNQKSDSEDHESNKPQDHNRSCERLRGRLKEKPTERLTKRPTENQLKTN